MKLIGGKSRNLKIVILENLTGESEFLETFNLVLKFLFGK